MTTNTIEEQIDIVDEDMDYEITEEIVESGHLDIVLDDSTRYHDYISRIHMKGCLWKGYLNPKYPKEWYGKNLVRVDSYRIMKNKTDKDYKVPGGCFYVDVDVWIEVLKVARKLLKLFNERVTGMGNQLKTEIVLEAKLRLDKVGTLTISGSSEKNAEFMFRTPTTSNPKFTACKMTSDITKRLITEIPTFVDFEKSTRNNIVG